ncbi:MAG: formate--tetrahydrofolate ligase, partial [Actinomycetales bacterium]
ACQLGVKMADVLVTEAGFGADMGAERFFNVKCRASGLTPHVAVIVVTVRALKLHSGRFRVVPGRPLPAEMLGEDPDDVMAGADNLRKHIDIVRSFGVTPVVAINAFPTDHPSEHEAIRSVAAETGTRVEVGHYVTDGGAGAAELAHAVVDACDDASTIKHTYELSDPLVDKIDKVARNVYGADGIDLSSIARKDLELYEALGYGDMPVVIAKTHLSISHDPTLRGAPTGWRLPVREVRLAAGAGYVYAICGDMRTMPGLGTTPNAENIDIDADGNIVGLS